MPIEAVLRGNILITSDCQCAQDYRDFPIPRKNFVTTETMKQRVAEILSNYTVEREHMKEVIRLYSDINSQSMVEETQGFIRSILPSTSLLMPS